MNFKIDYLGPNTVDAQVELDRVVYGEDVEDVFHMSVEQLKEWDLFGYRVCIGALDEDDNVLGDLVVYHLSENTFRRMADGEISEVDLQNSDFAEPKEGNVVYCYISNFVVKDNNTRIAICLINKILKYFRTLKEKGVNVKGIATTGASYQGEKLCEKIGFESAYAYEELPNGLVPKLYTCDFEQTNDFSKLVNKVKEIFLENDKYL